MKVRFGLLLCFMESGGKLFQWKTSSYFLSFFLSFLFFFFFFFFFVFEIELFWLSGIHTIAFSFSFFLNHLNLMIKRHTLNSFFLKKYPNLIIKNYHRKPKTIDQIFKRRKIWADILPYNCSCEKKSFQGCFMSFPPLFSLLMLPFFPWKIIKFRTSRPTLE